MVYFLLRGFCACHICVKLNALNCSILTLFCSATLSKVCAVCCIEADGSCVPISECTCKLGPEKGVFEGSYPAGTILTMNCMTW